MHPFELDSLFVPVLVVFFMTAVVSLRATAWPAGALLSSFVKAAIFFVYFAFAFDGSYTYLDDWGYLHAAQALGSETTSIVPMLLSSGGGSHIGYVYFNAFAIHLLGAGYYAPVALNIVVTAFIAWAGAWLAKREFRLSVSERNAFFYFLLFFPDVLAWSIVNLKDLLVLLLHILALCGFSALYAGKPKTAAGILVAVSFAALLLRFYVPVLFAFAFVLASVVQGNNGRGIKLAVASFAVLTGMLMWLGSAGLQFAFEKLSEDFINPAYGFVRFLLTPVPFHTDPPNAVIDGVALMHWLCLPLAIAGFLRVRRMQTPFVRFFIMYFLIFVSFYSIYGELQGPRQRLQLDFAWALFQFLGILSLLRRATASTEYGLSRSGVPVEG